MGALKESRLQTDSCVHLHVPQRQPILILWARKSHAHLAPNPMHAEIMATAPGSLAVLQGVDEALLSELRGALEARMGE